MTTLLSKKRFKPKQLIIAALAFSLFGSIVILSTFASGSSTISGTMWQDINRNGIVDAGEAPYANKRINLYNSTITEYLGYGITDESGNYQISGLADGDYVVAPETTVWWELRREWVPTTGNSLQYYRQSIGLAGSATAHFGLRKIVQSTDLNAPLSSFIAPSGLKINSYVDAVSAQEIYKELVKSSLLGGSESPMVEIRFGFYAGGMTSAAAQRSNDGPYELYNATSYTSYLSWIEGGDRQLFHEYGHAWSLYYAFIVQQDRELVEYQKIRGIYGDPRVNTSYGWQVNEMIAEDYRQLFGSPNAASGNSQSNWEIPLATDQTFMKDGKNILKEYLMGDFLTKDSYIPSIPRDFRGDGISSNQIKLDWSASVDNLGIAAYDIYRFDQLNQAAQKVASVGAGILTYTDGGLNASATYTYFIKARDASGNTSEASSTIMINTLAPPPIAPTGLKLNSVSDTTASISWTASSDSTNVTDYDIYRDNQKVGTVNSPSTTYFDTGLLPTTTYIYTVKARNATGTSSEFSNPVGITTLSPDTQKPTAPTSLKPVGTTSTSVSLNWVASRDNIGVLEYRIYRVGGTTPIKIVTASTAATVSGLTKNTQYSFYVTAADVAGNESLPSNTVKVRTSRK